jgi:hypothetical protein
MIIFFKEENQMKGKRLVALILTALMFLALAACVAAALPRRNRRKRSRCGNPHGCVNRPRSSETATPKQMNSSTIFTSIYPTATVLKFADKSSTAQFEKQARAWMWRTCM